MRVAGSYQNSYFFHILSKLVINIWNDNISDILDDETFFIIKSISFKTKKLAQDLADLEKQEAEIIHTDPVNNKIMTTKFIKETKNYIEVAVDPNLKVDETFGYDSTIHVDVKFQSVEGALRDQKLMKENDALQTFSTLVNPKYNNVLVGKVVLQKHNS